MKKSFIKPLLIATISPIVLSITAPVLASSLAQVYNQALNHNDSFKNAIYTYQQAKETLPLAYSNLLPQVSLSYSYSSSYSNQPESQYKQGGFTASLSQPLFEWSYFTNISAAKASVMSSYATFLSSKQNLIANTVIYYLDVIEKQKLLAIDEAYLTALGKAAKVNTQSSSGSSNDDASNSSQITAAYDQQKLQVITDQKDLTQALESLRSLTHEYYYVLKGPMPLKKVDALNPKDENAWVNSAEKNNLTVIAYRAALKSANASLTSARGFFLPSVSVGPSYTSTDTTQQGIQQNSSSTALSVSASIPVFRGGANWITISQDKYGVEAAQKALDDAIQTAVSSTRKDYVSVKSADYSFNQSVEAVTSAEASYNATLKSYKGGVDNSYDLVSSLSSVVSAKKAVVQNLMTYFEQLAQLKLQVGTLKDKDIGSLDAIFTQKVTIPKVDYTA
jgi:outer membrane protein TolC